MSKMNKSLAHGNDGLIVGGVPRVDLLPAEVRAATALRSLQKRLGIVLVGVVAVVIVGIGASSVYALANTALLVQEQGETDTLLAEQRQFIEVRRVQQALVAVVDAERVGSWTEVQWRDYLKAVQASLPNGVTITATNVAAASPIEEFAQGTAPLQNARIATISFTAESPTLPDVPRWLDALSLLPGYAGANPDSVGLDEKTGTYAVTITMQVGSPALAGRFVPLAEQQAAEGGTEAGEDPSVEPGNETDDSVAQGEN